MKWRIKPVSDNSNVFSSYCRMLLGCLGVTLPQRGSELSCRADVIHMTIRKVHSYISLPGFEQKPDSNSLVPATFAPLDNSDLLAQSRRLGSTKLGAAERCRTQRTGSHRLHTLLAALRFEEKKKKEKRATWRSEMPCLRATLAF